MSTNTTFRSWIVEGHPARVECSLEVLNEINSAALEGFRRFRHGGVEIGGILVGSVRTSVVRVTGARSLDIEYGRGAVFLLTEADEESLRQLVRRTTNAIATESLEVVGCYESHTRRDAAWSSLETFDRFFSRPLAICFVLRPEQEGVASASVYVRDENGSALQAVLEGDFEEQPLSPPVSRTVAAPVLPPPVAAVAPAPVVPPASEPRPRAREPIPTAYDSVPPSFQIPQPVARRSSLWYGIPLLGLALAAGTLWVFNSREPSTPSAIRNRTQPSEGNSALPSTPPPIPAPQTTNTVADAPPSPSVAAKSTSKRKRGKRVRQRRARSKTTSRPAATQP